MMDYTKNKMKLFHNRALTQLNDSFTLMGQRCHSCGKMAYPVMERCPFCGGQDFCMVPLSDRGTVFGYNIVNLPVGPYQDPPIVCAYVDMPEGIRIFGQVKGDPEILCRGMPVEIKIGVIYTEKDNADVIGYYFVPCGKEKEAQA